MKNLFALIVLCATLMISCNKSETVTTVQSDISQDYSKYDVKDALVVEPTLNDVIAQIDSCKLWPHDLVVHVMTSNISVDEKLRLLEPAISRNTSEDNLETIARKFDGVGNLNSNGSAAFWDCSPSLLAQTIAQLGTACDERAVNNYYNAGTSTTSITLSDVLRAANGVANTSFNSVIEINDLVFEYEVSGNNWIVGAVITYNGEEYIYSELYGDNGGLIYAPQQGGTYLLGPMPGGIVSVDITGVYEAPTDLN